jgi:hypothetical protein
MRTQAAPEIVRITLKSKPQRASGRVEIGG